MWFFCVSCVLQMYFTLRKLCYFCFLRFVHDVQHSELSARPPRQGSADQPGPPALQLHILPQLLDLYVLEHSRIAHRGPSSQSPKVRQLNAELVETGQPPGLALDAGPGLDARTFQRFGQGKLQDACGSQKMSLI